MNGPEHYREAERLLANAQAEIKRAVAMKDARRIDAACDLADGAARIAQVHATLALAAATAYPAIRDWLGDEARDGVDWSRITAPTPTKETP